MASAKRFNPFTENTAGEYFVGRESALLQFSISLNGLAEKRPSHIYVAGVHGTGKTSFLQKLSEISREKGFLGVVLTLDERHRGYDHVAKLLRAIIAGVDDRIQTTGTVRKFLSADWEKGKESSIFYHPRADQIESDYVHRDLLKLRSLMHDSGIAGAVICIDEGQRITPDALSSLKNALQGIDTFLIVISLRLVQDSGGAVGAGRALLDEKAREAEGDFGASRFFLHGVPMGAFETESEAAECIRRRLEGNAISFDDDVIGAICKITGRIPREVISFSSQLYSKVVDAEKSVADMILLRDAFAAINRADFRQAQALWSSTAALEKEVIKSLLSFSGPASLDDIMRQFGDIPDVARDAVVTGVAGALDRLQKNMPFCQITEAGFEIRSPAYRYALELAIEAKSL